tara:strand:- start:10566 stop:11165 length:600 start_codon:yes stop_codon:yes gene_type:complete
MEFYNKNHKEFSNTRHSVWKVVKDFSDLMTLDSNILDAGCGNGKNSVYIKNYKGFSNIVGFDSCIHFVDFCKKRALNVDLGDVRSITHQSDKFDFIMCIAVLHHLKTEEERVGALQELLRVLKPGGKLLITVWAHESDTFSQKRKFKLGNNSVLFNGQSRYYYVHDKNTFHQYCNKFQNSKEIFWERGNWNAIFEKSIK